MNYFFLCFESYGIYTFSKKHTYKQCTTFFYYLFLYTVMVRETSFIDVSYVKLLYTFKAREQSWCLSLSMFFARVKINFIGLVSMIKKSRTCGFTRNLLPPALWFVPWHSITKPSRPASSTAFKNWSPLVSAFFSSSRQKTKQNYDIRSEIYIQWV